MANKNLKICKGYSISTTMHCSEKWMSKLHGYADCMLCPDPNPVWDYHHNQISSLIVCNNWTCALHSLFIIVEYLRGFETFAETSFVVTDRHFRSFIWQRYGLKLHIPEGAVPAVLAECRVDIKAGFTGCFNIPDDLQLVSCVYWLSCPQKFMKSVTLEIEHCALLPESSQSSSFQFVVAKCSQAELPYKFRALEKGTFEPSSSYGSIEVSQFSFFGISIPKRIWKTWSHPYYSTLYYIRNDINNWDVDFVITQHLQAALAVSQYLLLCILLYFAG